jgi:DNA-binding SARP family transcriptional activator
MIVNIFGPLSVVTADGTLRGASFGGAQARATLELLLLARGNTVTKERIAEAVWGDTPPRNANAAIEQAVSTLRRRLFTCSATSRRVVQTEPNSYRIATELFEFDLDQFDRAWQRAASTDGAAKYEALSEAAAYARQELLADAPYAAWADETRERYRLQGARAHLMLAAWHLVHRRPERALSNCEDAAGLVPLSEEACRLSMVADAMLGHTDLARGSFRRFAATLHSSLGAAPSTETVVVATAIDRGASAAELLDLACPTVARPPIVAAA